MVKNIGTYLLIFFIIYTVGLIIYLTLNKKWEDFEEYISIRKKGYTAQHEETKQRENIYHARLVGKPRAKMTVSKEAQALLDEVMSKKEEASIDEFDEDISEMRDEPEPLPPVYTESDTNLLSDDGTGLLKDASDEVVSDTGLLSDDSTGLLSNEGAAPDESTGLLSNSAVSDESTGLLSGKETGLLSKDSTGLLDTESTGLLNRKETGLLAKDATGLLERGSTGLLTQDVDISIFSGD